MWPFVIVTAPSLCLTATNHLVPCFLPEGDARESQWSRPAGAFAPSVGRPPRVTLCQEMVVVTMTEKKRIVVGVDGSPSSI